MTLYLTEQDVTGLVKMPDVLRVVEEAFLDLGQGAAINPPRQRIRTSHGVLQVMPAGLPSRGYLGFKYYSSFSSGTRFWFHLVDANSGELAAVLQADRLGQQRTGAASGVATKYLARADADSVGLIGTGWQAESQLEAVCATRPIAIVRCYGRDAERRKAFAKKMSARLNVDVRAVDSAEEAVRPAAVVVTATNAKQPVLRGEWLAPGTHVNAIGSNRAEACEIDDETLIRSAFVCVDSIEQSRIEAGDLLGPIERGRFDWNRVGELGKVVAGQGAGRTCPGDITLFDSLGIAAEDVALGAWVYRQALARGVGRQIEL